MFKKKKLVDVTEFELMKKRMDNLEKQMLELKKKASQTEAEEPIFKYISTKALVEELTKREGVQKKIVGPYQDVCIKVNGPAIVLNITD